MTTNHKPEEVEALVARASDLRKWVEEDVYRTGEAKSLAIECALAHERIAALLREREAEKVDAERYRWLRDESCNQLYLTRNGDHACNYMSAKDWIEENQLGNFDGDDPEELRRMKDSNTIWCLQIYPVTPIGSVSWNGSTIDYVVDAARLALEGK